MTLEEMERRVDDWVNSPEGKRALDAAGIAARKAAEKVLKDARVDPAQMRIPCSFSSTEREQK